MRQLVGVFVLCVVASVGASAYPIAYNDRIYPGVSVHDVDMGELTVGEATVALVESLPDPAAQVVELRLGEQVWQLSWADAGQGYDYAGTAEAAYQVARPGPWYEQIRLAWETRLQGHRVAPLTIPADPARVASVLGEVAPAVSMPPVDAQLRIGPDGATPIPGQIGRALDVEASAAQVLQALADSAKVLPPASGGL
ncbi:MAG: peptidoglycan binding domain-containing protein, partial [Anaerolineae bacterium]|nr:peptidoglycan binding domain-containing protein [Anaerolineae bacterium]